MRYLSPLFRDAVGAVAVVWAVALPVVIGGLALGTDVGAWYFAKRNLQNATDVATLASAYEITGANPQQSAMYATASQEMVRNGYPTTSITLAVLYPPQTGAYAGNVRAVEVTAQRPEARYFSKLFLTSDPTLLTRAVALRLPEGSACVLSLSGTASSALLLQGSTSINLNNCSAASNSTSSQAINISGSSTLNAYSLYTTGNYTVGNPLHLTTTEQPLTNATPLSDPLSDLDVPVFAGCGGGNNTTINNTRTINPGVYCNGLRFGANANVTMNPGVYIIDRGDFRANAGAVAVGNGVTIILTSRTASGYATVSVSGNATLTLSAPTSGTYEGVLFYQDRNAPIATNTNQLNGGSTTTFTGMIYFPKQELQFSGNNSNGGGACTKIIANTITFTGNSYMSNNCPASVATIATQGLVQLVE